MTAPPVLPPRVLIVGAGVVGRSIAQCHLQHGIAVTMTDADADALSRTCDELLKVDERWSAGPVDLPGGGPPRAIELTPTSSPALSDRGAVWLVNESVPERLELKRSVLSDLQRRLGRSAIYTSNTSTLSIGQIASGLPIGERMLGLHFFMPVPARSAAELVAHRGTDPAVLETVRMHVLRLGKTPLVVADSPGFVVNRLLAAYLNTSLWLLCGGVSADQIAGAAARFGMPLSPLALIDTIGVETALDGGRVVWSRWPNRMDPSPLLAGIVKHNRRVGRCRLLDDHGQLTAPVADLVDRYEYHGIDSPRSIAGEPIAALFAAVMAVDAELILEEGVADEATIDAAVVGGLGWVGRGGWLSRVREVRDERFDALCGLFGGFKSLGVRPGG